eukprot:TRINITY_DN33782_c0_g1_i1.p1 TRINITY_DN33782_c0_g1~~TRINITY_DN33782_c0_g1_i1.p1  ORF type:complete len:231 (-),score=22.43 TRINITY_DN33782_c0_g1_i1:464-1156(-)
MLAALRDHAIAHVFVDVFEYCWCHTKMENAFQNSSSSMPTVGAFSVFQLAPIPPGKVGARDVFQLQDVFELLWGMITALVWMDVTVRDLQVKHFGYSPMQCPRCYHLQNVSVAFPSGRHLSIFDLATYKVHQLKQNDIKGLLKVSKYNILFRQAGYPTEPAFKLYKWTIGGALDGLSGEKVLELLASKVLEMGGTTCDDMPMPTGCEATSFRLNKLPIDEQHLYAKARSP